MTSEEFEKAYTVFDKGGNIITSVAGDENFLYCDSVGIGVKDFVAIAEGYAAAFQIIEDLTKKLKKTTQIGELQLKVLELIGKEES